MKPQAYFKKFKPNRFLFARKVKISESMLCLLLQGKRNFTPGVALRFEKATGGKVDRLELLYPKSKW